MLVMQNIGIKLLSDPRHFQILSLGALLSLQIFWADFGPTLSVFLICALCCCAVQTLGQRFLNISWHALKSPLITAFSLSILLKASSLWLYPLAAIIAIGSKFVIRSQGKHIFNPANIAIVALLVLFPNEIWISPGQWGSDIWLGFLLSSLALLVLYRIPSADMGPMFFAIWAALLFGRAFWLGDPLSIPMHQLQNGAVLIFAFFMISDPKTIPDTFKGRFTFAVIVALIAYVLTFEFQNREALFYALALGCLIRPVIDRLSTSKAFEWSQLYVNTEPKGEKS